MCAELAAPGHRGRRTNVALLRQRPDAPVPAVCDAVRLHHALPRPPGISALLCVTCHPKSGLDCSFHAAWARGEAFGWNYRNRLAVCGTRMSFLFVMVGQCGNQLGEALFSHLHRVHAEALSSSPSPFFAADGKARCVLFDTEPKVVQAMLKRSTNASAPRGIASSGAPRSEESLQVGSAARESSGPQRGTFPSFFKPENAIYGQSGRGNNWALGYYGVNEAHSKRSEAHCTDRAFQMRKGQRSDDDQVLARVLRAIQRETRQSVTRRAAREAAGPSGRGVTGCSAGGNAGRDPDDWGPWGVRDSPLEGDGSHADGDFYDDCFEAIVVVHSLAGGTGSGAASRLIEKIKFYFVQPARGVEIDELQEARMMEQDGLGDSLYTGKRRARWLVSIAVAPQLAGENATQGINATLTLHTIQRFTDLCILLRNDDAFASSAEEFTSSVSSASSSSRLRHRPGGDGMRQSLLAAPGRAKGATKPLMTFDEVNEYFVALLLPVFHYGNHSSALEELIQQCCPPRVTPARQPAVALGKRSAVRAAARWSAAAEPLTSSPAGGNIFVSLLPIPQRSFAAFRHSVTRCMFFEVTGGKVMMPGARPYVPIDELLTPAALEQLDASASWRTVAVPKEFQCAQTAAAGGRQHGSRGRCTSLARDITAHLEGVMALNQTLELGNTLLFPLLLDCALKANAGAYMAAYEDAGVSVAHVTSAYRTVARVLTEASELAVRTR